MCKLKPSVRGVVILAAIITPLILVGLLTRYSWGWGFRRGFVINPQAPADAIQLSILLINAVAALLVILYVIILRRQTEIMEEQTRATKVQTDVALLTLKGSYRPVISLELLTYSIARENFALMTRNNKSLTFKYRLWNQSPNRADCAVKVTPYSFSTDDLKADVYFNIAKPANLIQPNGLTLEQTDYLNGKIHVDIDPYSLKEPWFSFELTRLADYINRFVNAHPERFPAPQGFHEPADPKDELFRYVKLKENEHGIYPDPIWLLFYLRFTNPDVPEDLRLSVESSSLFNVRFTYDKGYLNVIAVPESIPR